jgi:hypothetical protein
MLRRTSVCPALTGGARLMVYESIPALYDMLQGMDSGHFQGRGSGTTPERIVKETTCECTRPNKYIRCIVCGYVTVGRIRKLCPQHPTVSVFTTRYLLLGAFTVLQNATFVMSVFLSVRQSVRPRGINWLQLDGFS